MIPLHRHTVFPNHHHHHRIYTFAFGKTVLQTLRHGKQVCLEAHLCLTVDCYFPHHGCYVDAGTMLCTVTTMRASCPAFSVSTAVVRKSTARPVACDVARARTVWATPRLSAQPSSGGRSLNVIPSVAYAAYFSRLFLFPPFPHDLLKDLQEAWNLSLNFGYVIPVLLPDSTAVIHPMVEAIFHIVVSWALLLVGFASHDVLNRGSKPPIQPFLLAALFLTNIVYLPYLALRTLSSAGADTAEAECTGAAVLPAKERSMLIEFGESSVMPVLSLGLFTLSVPWGLFARPEFGSIENRFASFVNLTTKSDILSYSFAVDIVAFALFQATLVDDDAKRRSWSSERVRNRAVVASKLVPFAGLAFYLLQRSRHAPLRWSNDSDDA